MTSWADETIVTVEHGPYRSSWTPYAREWQESAAVPWVHQITIVAGTQVGKTQSMLNVLAWAIAQDPGPITWVAPTREDAAEFGGNKVVPMIEASPALRAQLRGGRFDAKRRQIHLRRCRLLFRSARVPKELASYPARWLFGDEANKWPIWTQSEAAPFDLARERTHTFWNHKIVLSSTPTLPEGLISTEFERGDRRRYWVPCPHCQRYQVLVWDRVRWDESVQTELEMLERGTAWYECMHCDGRIVDSDKRRMLERGVWCPAAVECEENLVEGRLVLPHDRAAHRSYHIWAGYSPWLSWRRIAAEHLRSQEKPQTRMNFVNSWLAEPWVERVDGPSTDLLQACVSDYQRGEVPEGVRLLTAFVDVQKSSLPYVVRGWGNDMESWLVEHGVLPSWEALVSTVLSRTWPRGLLLRGVAIDLRGGRAGEVIDLARRWPSLVKVFRGVEMDSPIPYKAESLDKHPATGAPIGALRCWHINVGIFKDLVSHSVRVGGAGGPNSFHVYRGVDRAYVDEMASEHKVLQRTGDRERERWVVRAGHRANHYWDCEVGNRALAQLLGVHSMRSSAPPRRPSAPAAAKPGAPKVWRRTL